VLQLEPKRVRPINNLFLRYGKGDPEWLDGKQYNNYRGRE
jgi:hypothetical protein